MTSNYREHRHEIKSFMDLTVWQQGRQLVKEVYVLTRSYPREEQFGLVSQMRRAAVSVPSNIAEGWGRGTRKDYVHFLHNARGSLYELQTQLVLSEDLGLAHTEAIIRTTKAMESCGQLLSALVKSLERSVEA